MNYQSPIEELIDFIIDLKDDIDVNDVLVKAELINMRSKPRQVGWYFNGKIYHDLDGGQDSTYEAIKVIEAWELGFNLGNVIKYISRAGKKGSKLEDLKKAQWYLNREIEKKL